MSSGFSRERLAFNLGPETVPGRGRIEAAIRDSEPTFATAEYAEPRDWGYVGLMAFTAVLLLRPQDQLPGLTALHVAEICAIIGIGPMLLHRFARRLPVFRVTPETTGLALFGATIVATAPFSIWPGGAIGVFTDSYLKMLVVFVLMMNTLTTPKRLERLTWLMVLCIGYVAARGVFDYARGVNLIEGNRLAGSVGGIFGNPNDLALNMVAFLPMAIVVAIAPRNSTRRRATAAVIVLLMAATVVFTKSRGGVLGLAVMMMVLLMLAGKIRRGFSVVAVVAVVLATPFLPRTFIDRMTTIFDDQADQREFTGSRESRVIVMKEGMRVFMERPLTGVGAGQFPNYNPHGRKEQWRETHNALLQTAAELGIVGIAAFLFLIIRAAMAARSTRQMILRYQRRRPTGAVASRLTDKERQDLYAHAVAMTAGLAGWFVCSMFASVAYNWTFYYLLALTVAARELTRDRLAVPATTRTSLPTPRPAAAHAFGTLEPSASS
jgi:O-antigen ligase